MANVLTIVVRNASNVAMNFFVFQQPSIYSGLSQVYSNSINTVSLPPFYGSEEMISVTINIQFYVAAQAANPSAPQVGMASGFGSAARPIDLALKGDTPAQLDCCTITLSNGSGLLGLAQPINAQGVQEGSFRIVTPKYNPALQSFNAGCAVMVNNHPILSNFIVTKPEVNIDCQPLHRYFLQAGSFAAGSVINFTQHSVGAALCDFTGGHSQANAIYGADGTWRIEML